MSNVTIGLIINTRHPDNEIRKFRCLAQKVGVGLVIFNAAVKMDPEEIRSRAAGCDIILNNSADYLALEIAKTLEAMNYRVSESTRTAYYTEDKWLQYLQCRECGVPVPKTILLSTDFVSIKNELKDFGQFPVILKRIIGYGGDFVDKADNADEAIAVIKKFWKKGEQKFPIIAQEFVESPSYRVLTIGGEVVQTAVKRSKSWKATGCYSRRCWKFKVDDELATMLEKLNRVTDLSICGYDLAKHHGRWVLIEINGTPSYTFYYSEHELLIEKVLRYAEKLVLEGGRKVRKDAAPGVVLPYQIPFKAHLRQKQAALRPVPADADRREVRCPVG